jgi:pSer/pThr/pTyr-binding forkhead associated (FHA) protein
MRGTVTLKVKKGDLENKKVIFKSPTRCILGRARVCQLRVPGAAVSRFHCLLDIDPPTIHIRDLGSRNGTFVNGELIGIREAVHTMEETAIEEQPEFTLHSGDEVEVGGLVLEVGVMLN